MNKMKRAQCPQRHCARKLPYSNPVLRFMKTFFAFKEIITDYIPAGKTRLKLYKAHPKADLIDSN